MSSGRAHWQQIEWIPWIANRSSRRSSCQSARIICCSAVKQSIGQSFVSAAPQEQMYSKTGAYRGDIFRFGLHRNIQYLSRFLEQSKQAIRNEKMAKWWQMMALKATDIEGHSSLFDSRPCRLAGFSSSTSTSPSPSRFSCLGSGGTSTSSSLCCAAFCTNIHKFKLLSN